MVSDDGTAPKKEQERVFLRPPGRKLIVFGFVQLANWLFLIGVSVVGVVQGYLGAWFGVVLGALLVGLRVWILRRYLHAYRQYRRTRSDLDRT